MICPRCSGHLIPGRKFCGSCGFAVEAEPTPVPSGAFVPAAAATSPSPGMPAATSLRPAPAAMPTNALEVDLLDSLEFKLAHDEVVKGSFDIAGFTKRLGSMRGRLVVTDARVLYKARARNILNESSIDEEIQLQDVCGLALRAHRGLNPIGVAVLLMMGIGFLLVEVALLLTLARYEFGSFLVGSSVVLLVTAIVGFFVYTGARMEGVSFSIQTRSPGSRPIQVSGGTPARFSLLSLLAFPLLPLFHWLGIDHASTSDAEASLEATREMFDEIGALILDLQNRGVLADAAS